MPQIFHHSTNTLSKVSIFGALFLLGFLVWSGFELSRSAYVTQQGVAREQPVQFSHAHHVGGLGIHCSYCHASAEVSAFAGIPPTETCINCHSQIWTSSPELAPVRESFRTGQSIPWRRVHDLAEYSYFNHSIHVAKGVGCETCHGRVDLMPLVWKHASLQMEWCLNCHFDPAKYLRPREAIYRMGYLPPEDQAALGKKLVAEYKVRDSRTLTSCNTCHR
jgi:Cytochrome c7 and related cytochrome c